MKLNIKCSQVLLDIFQLLAPGGWFTSNGLKWRFSGLSRLHIDTTSKTQAR